MWMCRYGVGLLEEPIERADDWILMADHSNQIGTDKVLVILGIRANHMPPSGQALRYEDMRVMAVVPGSNWQREDVAKQYKLVAQRTGTPLAIVTDGAVELRESAVGLENEGKIVMMFRDFKHVAANEFKRLLEQDNRFASPRSLPRGYPPDLIETERNPAKPNFHQPSRWPFPAVIVLTVCRVGMPLSIAIGDPRQEPINRALQATIKSNLYMYILHRRLDILVPH
jgi:hypothetical protein